MSLSPATLAILEKQLWPGNVRELRNMLESMVVMSSGNVLDVPDLPVEYGGRDAVPATSGASPVAPAAPLPGPATDGGATHDPDDAGVAAAPTYEAGLPMAELEKRHILKTLAEQDNNRTRAARVLGIGRRTLQRKLEEYKDQGDEVPPPAPD